MKLSSLLTLSLIVVFPLSIFGQKINLEHFEEIQTRNIGPAGMSGRVTSIDVIEEQPEVIYIGTASGGVWRSQSGGITWEPIFDEEAVQSVGALTINQNNPSEIWVGTGEGNPRNSHNSGAGIYKSLDGGKNWKLMGLESTKTIHRIIIHRDDPNTVFVGATGSAWGPNPERGVFQTKDGGATWEKILFVNDSTGCADLVVDPSNPNKLIAAMWEHGRKPWTFNSGGKGSGIYVSFDGGENWEKRTSEDGLPKGDLGRIGLAIAPSKPNIIYALVEAKKNALYKSTDGGFKWKKIGDENVGNRPFYYSDIFVDPLDEDRVYSLWSRMSKSEDGGKTFGSFGGWGIHPDHHAFYIHPENPDYIINGNDGGLYISRDRGENWYFVNNLPVGQFYHVNYDMEVPYNVGGGMQDNGTWVGPSSIWQSGGIANHEWQEVRFGDGFDLVFRPDNSRYVYAMSQGGNVAYIDRNTGDARFIRPVHPEGVELRFHWNAAIAQDPFNDCGVYFGSQFVHKSLDCGYTWEIISPDLTTNDTLKQKQYESGGLTIDDTKAENHTTIIAIAPSPVDEDVIWVGTDDGNLQLTRDGGKNWVNLADKLPTVKPGSWIPFIELSQKNAGEAFVVVNDYRRNDWRPMVFHTKDFGQTFTKIADENQVSGHALSIVQAPDAPELLWLGTDFGLYFSIDYGKNWNKWDHDFPSVSTRDLKIHPRDKDLIIGTFGRSIWILDDLRPFEEIAQTDGAILDSTFRVFPAPDAYLAEYRSVDGTRFIGSSGYRGDNKPSGAIVTIWTKPEEKKEKPEEKEKTKKKAKKQSPEEDKEEPKEPKLSDKVKVRVLDTNGDTIRTFTREIKRGMDKVYWNLRRDGVRLPSSREPRPDADPPTGPQVLPGTYKLLLACGDYTDSVSVTVKADPRIEWSMDSLKAKLAAREDYHQLVEKANEGLKRIQEAEQSIKLANENLLHAPDSIKKEIAEISKGLKDSLSTLEEIYLPPSGRKGIHDSSNTLRSKLNLANSYLYNSKGVPSPSARIALRRAREATSETLEKINRFMENDFKEFQEKIEAIQHSIFKPYEPLKLE